MNNSPRASVSQSRVHNALATLGLGAILGMEPGCVTSGQALEYGIEEIAREIEQKTNAACKTDGRTIECINEEAVVDCFILDDDADSALCTVEIIDKIEADRVRKALVEKGQMCDGNTVKLELITSTQRKLLRTISC